MFDPTRESIAVTTLTACRGCGEWFAFRLILTDAPLRRRQWQDGWFCCQRCEHGIELRAREETTEITLEAGRAPAEAERAPN